MPPLESQITELWGQITAATHRFLELVAEFDRTEGWGGAGISSCAHWLNVFCGIGMVAAREKVRVANAMAELPGINAAFREGRISYSKVRAMTRVATPENEATLLNIAIHGTAAHVERTVRYFRRVEHIEAAREAAEAHRKRFLQIRYDDDHMVIHGRLPVEVGVLVRQAIERAMELVQSNDASATNPACSCAGDHDSAESSACARLSACAEPSASVEGRIPEDFDPVGARRADALRLVAEQFLAQQELASASSSERYQVVVHIGQEQLAGQGATAGPMLPEIEDGPPLAAETARRLACDAALVGMIDDDNGEPLSLGRKTRALSPALKRALKARDRGCRFPGCHHTRFTEGHHIRHWANGGETSLANLLTLCHYHHHLVHEGGFSIARTDDGLLVFRAPDGSRLRDSFASESRFRGSALADFNRRRGIAVRPDTIVTRWLGETMDYSLAIDALLRDREMARGNTASAGH